MNELMNRLGSTSKNSALFIYEHLFFPVIVDEWHVLLKRYRLMESSHGELGSNSHVILDQKQVIRSIEAHPEEKRTMVSPF